MEIITVAIVEDNCLRFVPIAERKFNMVSKSTIFVVVIGILAGSTIGLTFSRYNGNPSLLFADIGKALQPTVTRIGEFFAPLIAWWNSIPSWLRGIITMGIPVFFAIFFAWTKTRAMNKLQQTEIEAQAKLNQMEGQTTTAQKYAETMQAQKTDLEKQVANSQQNLANLQNEHTSLLSDYKTLRNQLEIITAERNTLAKEVEDLKIIKKYVK